MKQILLIIFIILPNYNPSISEVRQLYFEASKSEVAALTMYDKLKGVTNDDDKVLVAYKAAAFTLRAKYEKGIKNKKKYFKEGVLLLENTIARYPKDIELRFIRLTIQDNAPKIVRYKRNIEVDKQFIINNLKSTAQSNLKNIIKAYASSSKSFSTAEKNVISNL